MKKQCLFPGLMLSLLFVYACEEEEATDDFPILERTYVHRIPGCVVGGNPEQNCEEWVEFLGGFKANILIGGDDIVFSKSFRVNANDQIIVYDETGFSSLSEIVFEYINQDTLQRMSDNSYWILRD